MENHPRSDLNSFTIISYFHPGMENYLELASEFSATFLKFAILFAFLCYLVPLATILGLQGLGTLSDKLNVLQFSLNVIVTTTVVASRFTSRFKFGESRPFSGSERLDDLSVLSSVLSGLLETILGTLTLFPWAVFYLKDLQRINTNNVIVSSVFSIYWSLLLYTNEFDCFRACMSLRKYSEYNFKDQFEIEKGEESAELIQVPEDEKKESVNRLKLAYPEIYRLKNYLRFQFYCYSVDIASSIIIVIYLLANRLPYSVLTVQLTTLSTLPFSISIANMALFNYFIEKIEYEWTMKTNLSITLLWVYKPDYKVFLSWIVSGTLYVLKNFIGY
jgi:hypothetical protein